MRALLRLIKLQIITNSYNDADCTGSYLMPGSEWATLAQNLLSVSPNWNTGIVGS